MASNTTSNITTNVLSYSLSSAVSDGFFYGLDAYKNTLDNVAYGINHSTTNLFKIVGETLVGATAATQTSKVGPIVGSALSDLAFLYVMYLGGSQVLSGFKDLSTIISTEEIKEKKKEDKKDAPPPLAYLSDLMKQLPGAGPVTNTLNKQALEKDVITLNQQIRDKKNQLETIPKERHDDLPKLKEYQTKYQQLSERYRSNETSVRSNEALSTELTELKDKIDPLSEINTLNEEIKSKEQQLKECENGLQDIIKRENANSAKTQANDGIIRFNLDGKGTSDPFENTLVLKLQKKEDAPKEWRIGIPFFNRDIVIKHGNIVDSANQMLWGSFWITTSSLGIIGSIGTIPYGENFPKYVLGEGGAPAYIASGLSVVPSGIAKILGVIAGALKSSDAVSHFIGNAVVTGALFTSAYKAYSSINTRQWLEMPSGRGLKFKTSDKNYFANKNSTNDLIKLVISITSATTAVFLINHWLFKDTSSQNEMVKSIASFANNFFNGTLNALEGANTWMVTPTANSTLSLNSTLTNST